MAIYRLIQKTVFEPKDIERLVTAYELTLVALRLKDRDDPITQLVAEKIIAIGRLGIEDPAEIFSKSWGRNSGLRVVNRPAGTPRGARLSELMWSSATLL